MVHIYCHVKIWKCLCFVYFSFQRDFYCRFYYSLHFLLIVTFFSYDLKTWRNEETGLSVKSVNSRGSGWIKCPPNLSQIFCISEPIKVHQELLNLLMVVSSVLWPADGAVCPFMRLSFSFSSSPTRTWAGGLVWAVWEAFMACSKQVL